MTYLRRRGKSRTQEYTTWSDMRQRCLNPRHLQYKLYGAKGIAVCERWGSFDAFMADMGPRPFEAVLARKDIAKDYGPDNCVWAPRGAYLGSRRPTPVMELDGESKPLPEWCSKYKISENVVRGRLYLGWPLGRALRLPLQYKRKTHETDNY